MFHALQNSKTKTPEMGKNIAKKIANLNKILHPKGRKAAQLTKKTLKAAGREKTKHLHHMKTNIVGEKVLWFKENLEPVQTYTPELTIKLIEKYLGRFDEELEQIKIKHTIGSRKGRQHASREDIIHMTVKNERHEFNTSGIEMPDVLNQKQLQILKNWSGELRYLQNFKLVRYSKGKLESMKNSVKNFSKGVKKAVEEQVAEQKLKEDQEEKETREETVKETVIGQTQMLVD